MTVCMTAILEAACGARGSPRGIYPRRGGVESSRWKMRAVSSCPWAPRRPACPIPKGRAARAIRLRHPPPATFTSPRSRNQKRRRPPRVSPGGLLQDAKTSRKSALLRSLQDLERAPDAIGDRPIGRSQTGGDGERREAAISPGDWRHAESLAPQMARRSSGCSRQLGFAGRSQGQGKHGSSVSCVGRPGQAAHSSVTGGTRSVKN